MDSDSLSCPPTLNILDHFQRLRLLKSSRKIEYILGTTPHILESSDSSLHHDGRCGQPHVKNKHRNKLKKPQQQQQQQQHHHHHHHRHHHWSARLQLSPLTDDDRSVDDRDGKAYSQRTLPTPDIPSPLPLQVRIPHLPARSRTPHREDMTMCPERLRRRQMAKLTRVLGENIPHELVRCHIRNAPPQSDYSTSPGLRRRSNDTNEGGDRGDSTRTTVRRQRHRSRRSSSSSYSLNRVLTYPPSPSLTTNHHKTHTHNTSSSSFSSFYSNSPPILANLEFNTSPWPPLLLLPDDNGGNSASPPTTTIHGTTTAERKSGSPRERWRLLVEDSTASITAASPSRTASFEGSWGSNTSNGSIGSCRKSSVHSITFPLLTSDQRADAKTRWTGEWNVKDAEKRTRALRKLKIR